MNKVERLQEVTLKGRVVAVTEAVGSKGPQLDIQCIEAGMSLNRTLYRADVLEAAAPLYEGARCFLDHNIWDSTVTKLAGSLDGARWMPTAQGVHAAVYPAVELEAGMMLLNLARTELRFRSEGILDDDESFFGFSHVAYVRGEWADDEEGEYYDIAEITEVESVDAVTFPAANGYMKSMTESRGRELVGLLEREQALKGLRFNNLLLPQRESRPQRVAKREGTRRPENPRSQEQERKRIWLNRRRA